MSTSRGPILHDRVTIAGAQQDETEGTTVPAMVYFTSTGVSAQSGSLFATEQLRAIVARLPRKITPTTDVVWWRGTRYSLDGDPMAHMRKGRLHHYTIPLQRTTTP